MTILKILEFPDSHLLKPTQKVAQVDDTIRELIDDMFATMYHDKGCGLAANQVGENKSIFIMDFSEDHSDQHVFINPEILLEEGHALEAEGCLSFPGIYLKIERPAYIKIKALDYDGNEVVKEFKDYDARCVHHEHDHLIGKTFFDYLKPVQRKLAEKKLAKNKKRRI